MTEEVKEMAEQSDQDNQSQEQKDTSYYAPESKADTKKDLSEISPEDKINHGVKERIDKIRNQYDTKINELQKKLDNLEQQKQPAHQEQGQQAYNQDDNTSNQYQQSFNQDDSKVKDLTQKFVAVRLKYDDFDKVLNTNAGKMVLTNNAITRAMEFADDPAEFLYNALKHNADDIKNILLQSDPMLQYNSIIQLHERTKSKPSVKAAPNPISLDSDEGGSLDGDKDLSVDARIHKIAADYHKNKVGR